MQGAGVRVKHCGFRVQGKGGAGLDSWTKGDALGLPGLGFRV